MVGGRGGTVAYRDTDWGLIPASPSGGKLTLRDGSTVHELSWAEVDQVLAAFDPLSPAPWWPVWDVERGTPEIPLRSEVFGLKRHAEFTLNAEGVQLVDNTEAGLGGRYADPPTMRGRADGQRRWSVAAVEREVAYAVHRQGDNKVLRAKPPWDVGQPSPFPALRRLMVKSPEMAKTLPVPLGARPGTRYLQTERSMLSPEDPAPVALDPGGDLADWADLPWFDRAGGARIRVATDPEDYDAVLLVTLDQKAVGYARPPRTSPIDEVVVDPRRIRRVGRVSGIVDADVDGLPGSLVARRPVHQEADRRAAVQEEAQRFGPRAFPASPDCR